MSEYNLLEPIELTDAELVAVSGGNPPLWARNNKHVEVAVALADQSNTATVTQSVSLASGDKSKVIVAGHSTLSITESSGITQTNTNTATT